MLEQFCGAHYSWTASPKPVPVNLIYLAANIYIRQLVPRAPRAMVTARDHTLKPVAADMQAWLDRAAQGMRLLDSLRTCAMNALFSLGIMKIGVAHAGDHTDQFGTTHRIGQPYAMPVSLDDWLHDMTATRYEYARWAGNIYEVSLDDAKDDPSFDKQAREALQAWQQRGYNELGDPRSSSISTGFENVYGDQDYEDQCRLVDVWLPKEKLLVTTGWQDSSDGGFLSGDKPLRVVKFDGNPVGPYRLLSLCDVPDNIMSAAPMQSLVDMHDALNNVWRKLLRQARRQKTVNTFKGTAKEDQENINRANDGEAVLVNFPGDMTEVKMGGMPPEMIGFAEQIRNITSWLAGNLDTMGGLSPQAQTLGQEELLSKSSSAQIAEMQDRTVRFTGEVMGDLGRHWWENPILYYEAVRTSAAGDQVPVSITPQMRQMPWDRMDWSIDPYSLQPETPATRLAGFLQILNQTIVPMMPMLTQQGYQLSGDAILEVIGRYGNYPDLSDILIKGPPPDMQQPTQMAQDAKAELDKPPMPAQTTRTNVRKNVPTTTNQGNSIALQQMAMGAANGKGAPALGR